MTVSLAKAPKHFLLAISALALFLKRARLAQDEPGAPAQLPGAQEEESEGWPTTTTEGAAVRMPARAGAADHGIEVGVIQGVAPLVGIFSGDDGLGEDMWAGTDVTRAQILLNQVPVGAPSPAMTRLVEQLLLTRASPPRGPRGGDPIIELRLERALEAGLIDYVPTLIDQATQLSGDPAVEQMRAETILLREGGAGACTDRTPLRFENEEAFWMKLRAYCFAHQGLAPAARLTADLLYDTGDEDELFQNLLERLSGNDAINVERQLAAPLTPLHLAMLRDLGIAPSADLLPVGDFSIARAFAIQPGWVDGPAGDLRLAMAERAARAGVLSAGELLAVYEQVSDFDPDQRTDQLLAASRNAGAASWATFAEAALMDRIPGTRAETLVAALTAAKGTEMEWAYASALGQAGRSLIPEDVLVWASHEMTLMTLINGNIRDAYDWFDVFYANAGATPRKIQSLRAAMSMAAPSERFAFWPEHALGWLEHADLGEYPHARLTAQLMWFDAIGYAIPEDVRDRLALTEASLTGRMPAEQHMANLRDAVAGGRQAEVVALTLVVLGPDGAADMHPAAFAEVLRLLTESGLELHARALASEQMIAIALGDVE